MKAVQINRYGGSDVAEIKDISEPSPKLGQVLVEVHAAGINPFDSKIRSGMLKDAIPLVLPYTPGGDFSGVVKKLGEDVVEFKVGDEIFGSALVLNGGSGAFAECLAANVKNSAAKPQNTDFVQAASLSLVGSSAIQALEEHIKVNLPSSIKS